MLVGTAAGALMLGSSILPAFADAPRPHRPDVVTEEPAGYVYNAEWVTGTSQDGGAKGQSIQLGSDTPDFAYYAFQNWWDQKLSDITKIRASFLTPTTTVNSGGSPRFSLELDADANGSFDCEPGPCVNDVVVYLDPATCSDPAPSGGGWIESDFTGDKTNCVINDSNGNVYTSDADGTAWSKLVAEYPDAKVWFMFLIQDATVGTNYVDRIMLDSAFFTKAP